MSKFVLFALVVVLAVVVSAKDVGQKKKWTPQTTQYGDCNKGRHGDSCIAASDCCPVPNMSCDRFAKRCRIQIPLDELLAKRKEILGRDGPDMK